MSIEIISASAGAGKTYNLALEMENAIHSGLARPDAVVAITYTNKAAAELARRLRRRLLAAGLEPEAARIRDGYLGTVHSVCQRLIAELAFEGGTSPYPEPAPERYSKQLFRDVTGVVTSTHVAQIAPLMDVLALSSDDTRTRARFSAATWKDHLQEIVGHARENRIDGSVLHASGQASIQSLLPLLDPASGTEADRDAALFAPLGDLRAWINDERDGQMATKGKLTGVLQKQDTWLAAIEADLTRGRLPSWSHLAGYRSKFSSNAAMEAAAPFADAFEAHLSHPRLHRELTQAIEAVFRHAARVGDAFTRQKQAERLLDFSDMLAQAARVLRLPEAQEQLRGRIDLLMVDEFQDTSPVQLEVVMALSALARRTVWVGDRKQAIFSFQGSDPALMEAVSLATLEGREPRVLDRSYRSRPPLVSFCSALFSAALAKDGFTTEEVTLLPACPEPEALRDTPALQLWKTTKPEGQPKAKITEANGIARHIASMLSAGELLVREEVSDPTAPAPTRPVRARDIAVLARTNDRCRDIASALAAMGIRARVAETGLGSTTEALLLRSALALIADPNDRMAAAEIARFTDAIDDPDDWLIRRIRHYQECRASGERDVAFPDVPVLQALRACAEHADRWSPEESVIEVFGALGLHERVLGWPDPRRHLANLEALRAIAQEYEDTCRARRTSATISGLVQYLDSLPEDSEQALPVADDAIRVLTYHKAKGLEWPVVVCAQLDKVFPTSVFNPRVAPADPFEATSPLAGRSLRWWPWPYGGKSKGLLLADRAEATTDAARLRTRANSERTRLLYVGFTRARDHLILSRVAGQSLTWLDVLTDAEGAQLLDLPWNTDGETTISLGDAQWSCTGSTKSGEDIDDVTAIEEHAAWFVESTARTSRERQHISPSAEELAPEREDGVRVAEVISLGRSHPLQVRSDQMSSVGEAIHGFLAADLGPGTEGRVGLATGLLEAWGLKGQLDETTLIDMADRFSGWLDTHAPGPRLPEWPVRWLRDDGRAMSGDIDLLVPVSDGWLLLDHKSFPGSAEQRDVKVTKWAGQLDAYRAAVQAATGQPVSELWIHLPVRSEVVRVEIPD